MKRGEQLLDLRFMHLVECISHSLTEVTQDQGLQFDTSRYEIKRPLKPKQAEVAVGHAVGRTKQSGAQWINRSKTLRLGITVLVDWSRDYTGPNREQAAPTAR